MYQKVLRTKQTKANPDGEVAKGYTVAQYQPTDKELEAVKLIRDDMFIGRNILTKEWSWFDNRTILEEVERNQKRFNSYIPPASSDPDESWRANTVRPLTRNKLISIAAHVTARMLYPNIFAQNKRDEEDKAAAEVMKDAIEWAVENSEYSMKFVGAVLGALTDPLSTLEIGFAEVMRDVKIKQADGSYKIEKIVDEFMSGFVQNYRQCNEVYLTNAYENNVQKQRAISVRTKIDYEEAKLLYGSHKNFKYVQKGIRTVFDDVTKTFYDVVDSDLINSNDVERVVYRNRYKDLELVTINGILVTESEECNPRLDKRYGLACFGYELINNGNFAYYKSAVNKLAPDQDVIDTMYNMVMDGTFLQLMPPIAHFGSEELTSSIFIPGSITSFKDTNTKLDPIGPKSDVRAGMSAISLLEKSMSESSQDQFQMGIVTPGERTAEEIRAIQENARTALGLFGKMLQNFVKQIGILMVGDIVQYVANGKIDIDEISGEAKGMKYQTILLQDKIVNGKKVTKKIRFTDKSFNTPNPTHEDLMGHSLDLMDEEEMAGGKVAIYDVNPIEFKKVRYLITVNPDEWKEKSDELEKALNLEAYDRLIQSPIISRDPEAMTNVTKDFLIEQFAPGESDNYLPKNNAQPQINMQQDGADAAMAGNTNQFTQKGVNNNLTSQITGGSSIKKLLKK